MSKMSNLDIILQNKSGKFSMIIDGEIKKCSVVGKPRNGMIEVHEWNLCENGSYHPTTSHNIPQFFASKGVRGKIKTGGHTYER